MIHVSDDLPRLLSGDATRDEALAVAEHLRDCPDCQQELVSALLAHASLTSAGRFAPEAVSPVRVPSEPDPDMSEVFATAHSDARWRRRRAVIGSVAAAAAVAGGIAVAVVETGGPSPSSRTVALAAFGVGTHSARATLGSDGTMRIDATSLPRADSTHFYEVWLTNPARTQLQAVGSIGPSNRATLTVAPNVMSRYTAIEISVQGVNQTAYSGTSVLRGNYR